MKRFIRRTFLFLLVFAGLIAGLFLTLSLIERNYSNFKLANNPRYIVVGHSHPECAYNDSLIPNLKNLSFSGESYFFTYFKVKEIIKHNPSITTVFIEIANNQITERMNLWTWGNNYMATNYPKYFSFMTLADNGVLIRHNPSAYFNVLSFSMKNSLYRVFKRDLDFTSKMGGYVYLNRDITDSVINAGTQNIGSPFKLSEVNLSYLDRLIAFCKNNGVNPVLIRSPLHPKYGGYVNEQLYKDVITQRYGNIDYLDFSRFPVNRDEFGDLQHLNYRGSKVFSIWFNELLQSGLLTAKDKSAFVQEAIRKRSKYIAKNATPGNK